ncbi:MAG: MTH1187 family thiamine-binding protein [Selenomonadaceae bacterium]|nr:MTH1187 family thiamine-binding protein [Selenomonadaceae bacterium]
MNTLVAVAIAPVGVGDELSAHVAEVVKIIRESGLPNKTSSMFTEIEGDWDAVMDVVKRATFVLAEKGIRTEVVLKADIRPGFSEMMDGKIDRLNEALNAQAQPVAQNQPATQPAQPKPVDTADVQARVTAALGRFGVRK